jgi:chromosome segregation ATPase
VGRGVVCGGTRGIRDRGRTLVARGQECSLESNSFIFQAALFGSQLLHRNNELEAERDGLEAERNDLLRELEQNREANDGLLQTTRNLTLEKGRLADVIESLEHDSTLDQSAIEELQQQHGAIVSNLSSEAKNAVSLRGEVDAHREELEAANAR